jgi:hypothetical protein
MIVRAQGLNVTGGAVYLTPTTVSGQLNVIGLASADTLSLQAIPNTVKPNVLYYDATTKAVSYGAGGSGPAPDLLPITLDKVNNNVGINKTNPQYDLDVDGEMRAQAIQTSDLIINTTVPGEGLYVAGEVEFPTLTKVTHSSVLSYNPATGIVNYMDASPTADILPITLDKTNNRVGINNAAPASVLDITGNVNTTGVYRINGADFVANRNTNAVAVGPNAGATTQGISTVAVGNQAGRYSQGNAAVAIGASAGTGTTTAGTGQGPQGIAVGFNAGHTTQGEQALAIGVNAGYASQGTRAIAIGYQAGATSQHANSIILNATNAALNSTAASSFTVKPIRNVVDATMPRLSYNATTGEIMYGNSTTDSLLPITLDKTNNRVGIRQTTPATDLDVNGTTSTKFLMLQSIPNIAQPDVLMYDPLTKAVSYGPASGGTYAEGFLSADFTVASDTNVIVMSVPLTAGKYVFTFSFVYEIQVKQWQWLQYDTTIVGGLSASDYIGNTGSYNYQHHVVNLNLDVARTINIYSRNFNPGGVKILAVPPAPPLVKSGWNYIKVA